MIAQPANVLRTIPIAIAQRIVLASATRSSLTLGGGGVKQVPLAFFDLGLLLFFVVLVA